MKHNSQTNLILADRFGGDSLIALATVENGVPHVRTVDAVYIGGAFYVVTHSLSGKMRQIAKNPVVAISGDWFTAHGLGENLGHVLLPENKEIMDTLRAAFAAWYDNGHTNEADINTCLLKIRLTDGVLFANGTRYDIDFTAVDTMDLNHILRNFLDESGKLKGFPAKRKMKVYALVYLARKIENDRDYSEREINDLLLDWHTFADPATLRRELYDYGFLDRSRDGKVYRLAQKQPTPEELGI